MHGLVNGTPWSIDNADPDAQAGHDLTEVTPGAPSPIESMFEHAGLDRMTRFDVYVSSSRYYLFMDGRPLGCTVLPGSVMLSGPVSVTFGDVFFDEGAEPEVCDASRPFDFQHRHQCHETTRHFDDLAFKSGVPLPAWDETRVPCTPY